MPAGINYAGPPDRAEAVTPSDSVDLPNPCDALWIGGAGNVKLIAAGDTDAVTFVAVPAGSILPVRTRRVYSTLTTATSIVAIRHTLR